MIFLELLTKNTSLYKQLKSYTNNIWTRGPLSRSEDQSSSFLSHHQIRDSGSSLNV